VAKTFQHLSDLVGEQFSAVCFVRDYVEFHFDGPILRSLSNPRVSIQGTQYHFPEAGSRDALCRLIGSTVRELKLEEHQVLRVTTTENDEIVISLDPKDLHWPEAMHFLPQLNGPIQVW